MIASNSDSGSAHRRLALRFAAVAVVAAAGLGVAASTRAQQPPAFPSRAVTMVVPYAPGGLSDGIGRLIAQRLGEKWKQPVVVENRPGGGTIIGTQAVARSAPDGHTILLTSFGYTLNQVLVKNLPYDAAALAPLNMVALAPNVLYVHPSVGASSVDELIAMARKNPGKLTFASSGNASSPHMAVELFASVTKTDIVHVPYKGTGPAMADVLGGQVTGIFDTLQSMQYAKSGRLRALAVATPNRMPAAPDVPTFAEAGLPAMEMASWWGYFVPAATPAGVRRKLFDDIQDVLSSPDTQARITALGAEPSVVGQAEFVRFLGSERERWTRVTRERHITLD
ncbi:MAG: tripartite tricarboxylate transporter substrate binding protein [Variovorax sp.]|nr:MAG: tripartite tricarboxylate transporter substrate binding protein [Variovorax sp.]